MNLKPGLVLQPWIDPRIDVRVSPVHGRGMFAREAFRRDEVALVWGGTVFSEADIQAGRANPSSITLLEEGLYLGDPVEVEESEDYCLNHSCDSNLWLQDAVTLVTRGVIKAGEELTIDYALWETDPGWKIEACRCGSPHCRGRITGNDWKLPELHERYGEHFSQVILGSIRGTADRR